MLQEGGSRRGEARDDDQAYNNDNNNHYHYNHYYHHHYNHDHYYYYHHYYDDNYYYNYNHDDTVYDYDDYERYMEQIQTNVLRMSFFIFLVLHSSSPSTAVFLFRLLLRLQPRNPGSCECHTSVQGAIIKKIYIY